MHVNGDEKLEDLVLEKLNDKRMEGMNVAKIRCKIDIIIIACYEKTFCNGPKNV